MKESKELEKARKVLGITKSTTENEVKRIYKSLVKKWHPDTNKSKQAKTKMQEINYAFQTIMEEQFGKIDPWKDYHLWWWKQFGNDPIWGNYVSEDKIEKLEVTYTKKTKKKHKKRITLVDRFLDKKNIFAVVGASKNPKKYGNRIYIDLRNAGYKVYPVNPNYDKVEGDKCYSDLKDLPELPDVVDIVVPHKVTEKVVKKVYKLGIKKVWMQPGSESDDAIDFCKKHGVKVLYNMCVMIKRKKAS